jgi:hypothetical protein
MQGHQSGDIENAQDWWAGGGDSDWWDPPKSKNSTSFEVEFLKTKMPKKLTGEA